MKVPVDSLNKGKEIALAEAKSILDKYKDNHPKFDVLDDVTGDELLSVNDAVDWLEGGTANKSKQSKVTADMLESNASMAGSDDNINVTQKSDDKNVNMSESKEKDVISRGEYKTENEEDNVKHISGVSARDEAIPEKDVKKNIEKAKMADKTKGAKEGKKEASKKEGEQE